jgi:hypothetical protein
MNKDFLCRIDDDGKIYIKELNIKTYHKSIRGVDMFVYRHKNNNWICIDTLTGSCIDNIVYGHKTKKAAFESAIKKYSTYTDDQIRKVHQNALEW